MRNNLTRNTRCTLCVVAGMMAFLFIACGGGGAETQNVNTPRGNSIGADRIADFQQVIAHARTLPSGTHYLRDLPQQLQVKNMMAVYVLPGKAYALEFPSHPIDSNPIYVFIEPDLPEAEKVAQAFVKDHGGWIFGRKLDDAGWYYVHGP